MCQFEEGPLLRKMRVSEKRKEKKTRSWPWTMGCVTFTPDKGLHTL